MSDSIKVISKNRRATYDYAIEDRFEAGMVLLGSEVKSLRDGKTNLQDCYCKIEQGEAFLLNCNIAPYKFATHFNHEPERPRKLLLNKKEIAKIKKANEQGGYTIVPIKMYFKNGKAKLEIGIGKGKKNFDKRQNIAERDSKRRMQRAQARDSE